MDRQNFNEKGEPRKFHFVLGEKIAYVEMISLTNYICTVEISGQQPFFITKIRDKKNKSYWISIPQGNDELAQVIGQYVDDELHKKKE
jgi:hypothetical protein